MALDERSKVSLTFGAYIKPVSHLVISCKYYDFHLKSYKKMIISRFFQYNASGIKFGLAVKKIKVNPDSSFVQSW